MRFKKFGWCLGAWLCSADSAVSVCFWCLALLFLALKMFSSVRWKLQRTHSIFRKREKNKEKMSNLCESIDSCCFEVFVVASFQVFLLSRQSHQGKHSKDRSQWLFSCFVVNSKNSKNCNRTFESSALPCCTLAEVWETLPQDGKWVG